MKNKLKIKSLLLELKEVNKVYMGVPNDIQIELLDASKFIIDELESRGVGRAFSETYVCYGDAFLIWEFGCEMDVLINKLDKH